MELSFLCHELPASTPPDAGWSYWRLPEGGIVELGTVRGCEIGLPAYFHDAAQIASVVADRRRSVIADEVIPVAVKADPCPRRDA